MNLRNHASRGQLIMYTFGQDALAANQTDVQLPRTIGEASQAVDSSVAPWYGDIVGIGWTLSAAGSAGAATVGASVDGTENANSTLSLGTATEGYVSIPRGKIPLVPGSNIGVELTTDGSWNGTSSDLVLDVYVLYRLDGI